MDDATREKCRKWLRDFPEEQRINSRLLKLDAYARRVSVFRLFSTCGIDSSAMLFSCLTSQYESQCPRRDWTTKRLSSLSLRELPLKKRALSPLGAAIHYLQIARCIGSPIEKKKKKNDTRKSRLYRVCQSKDFTMNGSTQAYTLTRTSAGVN